MRRLLLVCSIIKLSLCSCPQGFELFRDGECGGNYTRIIQYEKSATSTAISKCKEIQGQPIIIRNYEHQTYWAGKAVTATNPILGIVCNSKSAKWEWSDGSAIAYKPAMSVFDKACFTAVWWMLPNGAWTYASNNNTFAFTWDVFCTTQLKQPVPSADGCDIFADDKDDGVCYQIGAAAQNWQEAQMNCKRFGANLASIHSDQANTFVRRLAVSNGAVNGLFLGASIYGHDSTFSWIDGTQWNYANFYPGFPKPEIGACAAMDTSLTTGQWINVDCTTKFPIACVREQRPVSKPTCDTGPFYEGAIYTSPGFPFTASTPCDFFLTVDSGKKVELEIVFMEANSCCDSVILYDSFLGGKVIAKITGEKHNTTYTSPSNVMRVSWQPNGGVNVMGMAFAYYGI